jgi:hypothetical protein
MSIDLEIVSEERCGLLSAYLRGEKGEMEPTHDLLLCVNVA